MSGTNVLKIGGFCSLIALAIIVSAWFDKTKKAPSERGESSGYNARCPVCGTPCNIDEQYRNHRAGLYKLYRCPMCDQANPANVWFMAKEIADERIKQGKEPVGDRIQEDMESWAK